MAEDSAVSASHLGILFGHSADVILSAAKDLMPVASGDEVLRYAQDDRKLNEHHTVLAMRVSAGISHNIAPVRQAASRHKMCGIILSHRHGALAGGVGRDKSAEHGIDVAVT
jgi:hypothetical protein